MGRIGIMSTIPVEIILAAGHIPVDLNNIFVGAKDANRPIETAERRGFPSTSCAWIKGIYGILQETEGIDHVIVLEEGDCSQSLVLGEILAAEGLDTIGFSFPRSRNRQDLKRSMERLCSALGTTFAQAEAVYEDLKVPRGILKEIDTLSYRERKVHGKENHLWQVQASDFCGNLEGFTKEAVAFLEEAKAREALPGVPLGFLGVPPIWPQVYDYVEEIGGLIVFNEVQSQFVIGEGTDFLDAYLEYTYPYDTKGRIAHIEREIARRGLVGLFHYTQSFCYREMADMLFRDAFTLPILKIEGERPGPLDPRTKLRIEAFLGMMK